MAACALSSQKSVSQDPATKILFELLDHEVRKWVPHVLFDLLLEGQPICLDELVERGLFWFVALVLVALLICMGHELLPCLATTVVTLDCLYDNCAVVGVRPDESTSGFQRAPIR